MSYPFISIEFATLLGMVAAMVGLILQAIDERRGPISPILRQMRERGPLRDLGLALGTGGIVLALPGLGTWLAIELFLLSGGARDEVRDVFSGLRPLLPHLTFAVFTLFVLRVLASLIRLAVRARERRAEPREIS
ncbi:hypothetical protein [Amycolatopsis thailandensis]|uniref:hypothetical protein n=1 Tax=Amycolatopsis thailandensis TaxID=589330 RepID=UPI00117793B6|nr:hypothetical protein [Amycolatopsis thailandensis]